MQQAIAREQYDKDSELKKEDVEAITTWMKSESHLPEIDELQVILFLNSCYFDHEATKKCIENFYSTRTRCPEFFANRDLSSPELQGAVKAAVVVPLPKITKEGQCIFYFKAVDGTHVGRDVVSLMKYFDMVVSLRLRQVGACKQHEIVADLSGVSIFQIFKMNLTACKNYIHFLQEGLPFRLKEFHFVNGSSIISAALTLLKPFMNKELLSVIHVHKGNNEALYDFIGKEYLPEELGGDSGSGFDLQGDFIKEMEGSHDYYMNEEKLIAVYDNNNKPKS